MRVDPILEDRGTADPSRLHQPARGGGLPAVRESDEELTGGGMNKMNARDKNDREFDEACRVLIKLGV